MFILIFLFLIVGYLALRHQRHRGLPFLLPQIMGDDHHLLHLPRRILLVFAAGYRGELSSPANDFTFV